MKLQRTLYYILVAAAAAQLWYFYPRMPETMASHFNGPGIANGWMPRNKFVTFYFIILAVTAVVFNVLPSMLRYLPISMINLPNRKYWFSPERRAEAGRIMALHMYAAGNATFAFLVCAFYLVFRANLTPDGQLGGGLWVLLIVFLTFMVGWSIAFFRAFRLPDEARQP